jgi:hypothetical protein
MIGVAGIGRACHCVVRLTGRAASIYTGRGADRIGLYLVYPILIALLISLLARVY